MKKLIFTFVIFLLCLSLFACGNQLNDIRQAYINAGYTELTDFSLFPEIANHASIEEEMVFSPNGDSFNKVAIFKFSSVDALKSAIYENRALIAHVEGLTGSTPDELYNNAVQSGYVNKNFLLIPSSVSSVKKAEFLRIFSSVNL